MTGVGQSPRTLEEVIRNGRSRTTSLERQLAWSGAVDLSQYLQAGSGIAIDGLGSLEEPFTVSYATMQVEDWDDATESGSYWSEETALNTPIATGNAYPWVGSVRTVEGEGSFAGRVFQELNCPTTGASVALRGGRWVRGFIAGSWAPWRQGAALSGTVTIAGSGSNNYGSTPVTFPAGFFVGPPRVLVGNVVNTTGSSIIGTAVAVTTAGFTARAASNAGTAFGNTYSLDWIAYEPPS